MLGTIKRWPKSISYFPTFSVLELYSWLLYLKARESVSHGHSWLIPWLCPLLVILFSYLDSLKIRHFVFVFRICVYIEQNTTRSATVHYISYIPISASIWNRHTVFPIEWPNDLFDGSTKLYSPGTTNTVNDDWESTEYKIILRNILSLWILA